MLEAKVFATTEKLTTWFENSKRFEVNTRKDCTRFIYVDLFYVVFWYHAR